MLVWLGNWWDGVELWLAQQAFPLQFILFMAVLAPLCLVLAWAIDRAVDLVSARVTRVHDAEPPLGGPASDGRPAGDS